MIKRKQRKKKKKQLSAKEFNGKVEFLKKLIEREVGIINWTGTREQYGEYFMPLIQSGLIVHSRGKDVYHHGITLSCIFNIQRANGSRGNLKPTATFEALKKGRANLNSGLLEDCKKVKNLVLFAINIIFLCRVVSEDMFSDFLLIY